MTQAVKEYIYILGGKGSSPVTAADSLLTVALALGGEYSSLSSYGRIPSSPPLLPPDLASLAALVNMAGAGPGLASMRRRLARGEIVSDEEEEGVGGGWLFSEAEAGLSSRSEETPV